MKPAKGRNFVTRVKRLRAKLRPSQALKAGWFLVVCAFLLPTFCRSAGRWRIEVVDSGNGKDVGRYSSLAIDRFGNLQIAYYDATDHSLWYAYRGRSDAKWYTMQVDRPAGTFASLAVDAQGYPHITSNSWTETGLHYDYWDGKNWHKFIVDPEHTDRMTSLQVDRNGHLHVSYYVENNASGHYALYMKYAYFDGKTWYLQTVDHTWLAGKANSLALGPQGQPWIAYVIAGQGDLAYAHQVGAKWEYGTAETRATNGGSYVGFANSIAIDRQGYPHITYIDGTKAELKYAWEDKQGWHAEIVDQLSAIEADWDHTSLQIDKHGLPHVAYYDPSLGALKYASRDAKGWHVQVVDNDGDVGEYPSLCLDAQDVPYISYYDVTNKVLRIAYPGTTDGSAAESERTPGPRD